MTNEEVKLIEQARRIIWMEGYNSPSRWYTKECDELSERLQQMIDKYRERIDIQP